jgi:hypothetical protein
MHTDEPISLPHVAVLKIRPHPPYVAGAQRGLGCHHPITFGRQAGKYLPLSAIPRQIVENSGLFLPAATQQGIRVLY